MHTSLSHKAALCLLQLNIFFFTLTSQTAYSWWIKTLLSFSSNNLQKQKFRVKRNHANVFFMQQKISQFYDHVFKVSIFTCMWKCVVRTHLCLCACISALVKSMHDQHCVLTRVYSCACVCACIQVWLHVNPKSCLCFAVAWISESVKAQHSPQGIRMVLCPGSRQQMV